jgi:SAM-dependent methyltransferase
VPTALSVYGAALRRAVAGRSAPLVAVDDTGERKRLDLAAWCGSLRAGDTGLLAHCADETLDVGCGAGRLLSALRAAGRRALGVDVSADAVALTRQRGAAALRRNVFAPLPQEGQWRRVLLADGNIGIGGHPVRLLRRCAQLSTTDGEVLVELDPPNTRSWAGTLRLHHPDNAEQLSTRFPWAFVAASDLETIAAAAALRVLCSWTQAGRWFARLAKSGQSAGDQT